MPARRDLANAIRILSMDAVQQANSGHPGMPMGMADIAEVLFNDHLKMNPANPNWVDRDRFILSNGHGSMLQYAALHLAGYDLSLDDIKAFRQLHSKTPGHPENFMTPGVETTTGPLGQGLANAVGMALAEAEAMLDTAPPVLRATISAMRWSTSVPVMIDPFTTAVARRTLGSSLPNRVRPSGISRPTLGTGVSLTVCAGKAVGASRLSAALMPRRLVNFIRSASRFHTVTGTISHCGLVRAR